MDGIKTWVQGIAALQSKSVNVCPLISAFQSLNILNRGFPCRPFAHDTYQIKKIICAEWYHFKTALLVHPTVGSFLNFATLSQLLNRPAAPASHVSASATDTSFRACLHHTLTAVALLQRKFVLRRAETSDVVPPCPSSGSFVSLQVTTYCAGRCGFVPHAGSSVSDQIF